MNACAFEVIEWRPTLSGAFVVLNIPVLDASISALSCDELTHRIPRNAQNPTGVRVRDLLVHS
jgi:hypothetical protein